MSKIRPISFLMRGFCLLCAAPRFMLQLVSSCTGSGAPFPRLHIAVVAFGLITPPISRKSTAAELKAYPGGAEKRRTCSAFPKADLFRIILPQVVQKNSAADGERVHDAGQGHRARPHYRGYGNHLVRREYAVQICYHTPCRNCGHILPCDELGGLEMLCRGRKTAGLLQPVTDWRKVWS